jgi:hypothetical protein
MWKISIFDYLLTNKNISIFNPTIIYFIPFNSNIKKKYYSFYEILSCKYTIFTIIYSQVSIKEYINWNNFYSHIRKTIGYQLPFTKIKKWIY